MQEGFITAGLTAVPTSLILYTCLKSSPAFVKSTNWSSRTAMAIMPPLFAFAWGAEVCVEEPCAFSSIYRLHAGN